MNTLLYKIPENLLLAIRSGEANLVGTLIKDATSGKILAHVQPTRAFDAILHTSLNGVASTFSQGFNPLGLVTAIQNEQIKSRLTGIQSTLGLMQNLQIANLAVSGLGLGVSVVGFAVMMRRLKGIESHISALGEQLQQVTADRRGDELATIFADIQADLEAVDTLASRKDPTRVAEAAQISLDRSAARISIHFQRHAERGRTMTADDLDLLWTLGSAMRLCSDASVKALLYSDEVATARDVARGHARRFRKISEPLSPDALARSCAASAATIDEMTRQRAAALGPARTLVSGLRASAAGLADQAALAATLLEHAASGRTLLEEAQNEQTEPLLALKA